MKNSESWVAFLAAIFIGLIILFLFTIPVRAQEHRHPKQHEALHHKFYKLWKMPTNRAVSCCNDQDCKPAEAYMKDGRWYARHEGDEGPFTLIPKERVDIGLPDSPEPPDFRSHLCGMRYGGGFNNNEFTVFCFIAAPGG
jgi:hypothetical protein